MKRLIRSSLLFLSLLIASQHLHAQNETAKWYFGNQAGLDFMTNPPTVLTNGVMSVTEGCSSISNSAGQLLFYTDGITVYNSLHQVMANGTGLFGNQTPVQSSIIIRKPGSTSLYYIFTVQGANGTAGLNYSIVDMTLASGQGSVTVKNSNLYSGTVGEKLSATKHCNGVDYWVMMRDWTNNASTINFRAYLLTPAGVGTTAVVSPAWAWNNNFSYYDLGAMKFAPNGKKLGVAVYNYNNNWNTNNHSFEIYDFDNTTGIVSNSLALGANLTNTLTYNYGYGCEFSPDGTKFYGSRLYNSNQNIGGVMQYNLCAGSPTAIQASEVIVANYTNNVTYFASMQLAPNGKIYIANYNTAQTQSISVINTPNQAGAACGFSLYGQSIAPKLSWYGLPNFVASFFAQPPPVAPFTYTVSNSYGCQSAAFVTPITPNSTVSACSVNGFSLTNLAWNFGDPASGSANISFQSNPVHAFTTLGTYTVQLILYYSCGGGTDTLRQVVNINQPCISVNSTSITCANLGSATVQATGGIGPFSYTWMPGAQTSSVATGLSPGTYTLTVFDFGNNFTYTATTLFTSLIPLTGSISITPTVACFGASTGTGAISNLAGGSGATKYYWQSTSNTYTTAFTNSLSAGIWTVSAVDSLTGCSFAASYLIQQPPALSLLLSSSSPSACANSTFSLTGLNSGGTPGLITPYTYTWLPSFVAQNQVKSEPLAGTKTYTLASRDSLNCLTTGTISVLIVGNPTITVASASICPLKTGTLQANGATTYTWQNLSTGSQFTVIPAASSVYTLIGSAAGCSATASGSIYIYPLPSGAFSSNSPICNGNSLLLTGSGGATYRWSGPSSFTSAAASPVVLNANPANSGVYTVTVTSAVGCTMTTSGSVTVHPTPTISVLGSTVCSTGTLTLFANSFPGSSFIWTGPNQFIATGQSPQIVNPSVSATGIYNLMVFSPQTCSNSAQVHASVTAQPSPSIISDGPKCANATISFSTAGGAAYQWTGPIGFTSNLQYPQIYNAQSSASGMYSVTVYLGPCVASANHSLTVWARPIPTASATPLVCAGKSLTLVGGGGPNLQIYTWSGPNGFSSFASSLTRPNADHSFDGGYTLTVSDNNNCTASTIVNVQVEDNPFISASGATVCLNAKAVLKAHGGVSYFWQGPQIFQSSVAQPTLTSVTKNYEGTYTVTGSGANTCTSVAVVTVQTLELPQPVLSIAPGTIACPGTTFSLTGSGGADFQWSGPSFLSLKGTKITITPINNSQAGTYTLIAFDTIGCFNQTTVKIALHESPEGYLKETKTSYCVPTCSKYEFIPAPLSTVKSKSTWTLGGKIYGDIFTHCYTEPGTYEFIGLITDSAHGCKSTASLKTVYQKGPKADFHFEPELPDNFTPVLFTDKSQSDTRYQRQWSMQGPLPKTSNQFTAEYLFDTPGEFAVALVITDENRCSDTVIKKIKVAEDFSIYVPNVFSPNYDNLNDYFLPVLRGIKTYHLEIFNRWGERVFVGDELSKGWDGNSKEKVCPQDVYTWHLNVSSQDGKARQFAGEVTLLR